MRQLKDSCRKLRKHDKKAALQNAVCGKIIKKYKCMNLLKNTFTIKKTNGVNKRQEKAHQIVKIIKKFYDDNSTIDPSKKASKTCRGITKQRQYLNGSLIDLHDKFCRTSEFIVSYKTFTRYRPWYCVTHRISERDTCACTLHENAGELIKAMFKENLIDSNSTHKVIQNLVCEKPTEECLQRSCLLCKHKKVSFDLKNVDKNKQFTYLKWLTVKEDRISAKTKKPIVVQVTKKELRTTNMKDALVLYNQTIDSLLSHEYRIFHQYNALKNLKQKIQKDEGL